MPFQPPLDVFQAHVRVALKRLSLLLLLMLALFVINACTEHYSSTVEIDFWAMGREGEVVQQLIPEFERRHPEIRVRVQQIPWSAAHEKLLTAYAGDTMPDLFQLGNTWIPEFVALGALTELDPWIKSSGKIKPQDFFHGIMQTNVIAGLTYGIPWYLDTRVLFYRQDLLKRAGYSAPPKTWEEWIRIMRGIKAHVGGNNYAILLPVNEWAPLVILAMQLKAQLLKKDNKYGNFTSTKFREAFDFYLKLFQNELASPIGSNQMANIYQEFANGRVSMYVSGPWNIGEFSKRLPEKLQDHWMTAPMPGPKSGYPGTSLAGGASLAMYRQSEHKQAAWKLIEYLSTSAQQLALYRLTGDLPTRKAVWEAPVLADNVHTQAFRVQLQQVQSPPQIPEWGRIATKIAQYAEAVIRDQMSIDRALNALDTDVDRILEKRRWLLNKKH